ncbi:LOW QUALITY PROTEIN: hypothetical protein PanWU01x14_346240 [Parasponia andersonii]|uniref:Uncharacterized protein n=1 Tax=Parasponia andersonii TaxID=3476 RepID=A0A2P5ACE2_PARAD|nr:LOW QUALITY PROTEIN: hypothetical protein PanWU01x14_346240 [Parasponia andersonii]
MKKRELCFTQNSHKSDKALYKTSSAESPPQHITAPQSSIVKVSFTIGNPCITLLQSTFLPELKLVLPQNRQSTLPAGANTDIILFLQTSAIGNNLCYLSDGIVQSSDGLPIRSALFLTYDHFKNHEGKQFDKNIFLLVSEWSWHMEREFPNHGLNAQVYDVLESCLS